MASWVSCLSLRQYTWPILSWATPAPSQMQINQWTSPKKPPLQLSYSQVIKTKPNLRACDPGKYQVIKSPNLSCDLSVSQVSCDQSTRDRGKPLGDSSRDWSPTWSPGHVNFRNMTHPLINTWKTMGTINKVTRLTTMQSAAVILPRFDHPCTINLPALKGSLPMVHIEACPKAAHRPPCISI
jgi:hypothetical protein